MKTDANARWLVSRDVRSTYSEDGACASRYSKGALLQPQSCCCASLEHSGSKPFRSRSSRVETHYTMSREQLERDVDEYLSKLENIGLVQRNGLFHESKAASARG